MADIVSNELILSYLFLSSKPPMFLQSGYAKVFMVGGGGGGLVGEYTYHLFIYYILLIRA